MQTPINKLLDRKYQHKKQLESIEFKSIKVKIQLNSINKDIEVLEKHLKYEKDFIDYIIALNTSNK